MLVEPFLARSYFAPAVAASLSGIRWVDQNPHLKNKLRSNAHY